MLVVVVSLLEFNEYSNHLAYDDALIPSVKLTGKQLLAEVNVFVSQVEAKKASMTESSKARMEGQIMNIVGALSILTEDRVKSFLSEKKAIRGVGDTAEISYLSGARGSLQNVASAIASLGQLYVKNARLSSSTRLTPYSALGSKLIQDNGFILNSYASGLSPRELAQQAIIGRQSAWDMYNGTPEAGAASRQCCLHLDGIVIDDQFALVGREGEILSYLYGSSADTMYTSKKAKSSWQSTILCRHVCHPQILPMTAKNERTKDTKKTKLDRIKIYVYVLCSRVRVALKWWILLF